MTLKVKEVSIPVLGAPVVMGLAAVCIDRRGNGAGLLGDCCSHGGADRGAGVTRGGTERRSSWAHEEALQGV